MSDDDVVQENVSEREASVFGWVPKEEYKGDPEQWRDADSFLQRGKEINGFLRKDLDKLKGEISRRDSELAEIRSTVQEFAKYHQETEARTYARVLEELKQEKKSAIEVGDGERVIAIEDKIEEVKAAKQTPVVQPQQATDKNEQQRVFQEWIVDNPWYEKDKQLQISANGLIDEVRNENPNLFGRSFLDKVKEKTQEYFPEKFKNPSRDKPSAVEGATGSNAVSNKGKKTFADLPPEAQAACQKFEKQKILTREQYITDYFS
jgi:hypothetical protein